MKIYCVLDYTRLMNIYLTIDVGEGSLGQSNTLSIRISLNAPLKTIILFVNGPSKPFNNLAETVEL